MRFLITGATGLVGRPLIQKLLREGHEAMALVRTPQSMAELPSQNVFSWRHTEEPPSACFENVDVIVNLAGEGIANHRWTKERKRALEESRVLGTQNIVSAIEKLEPSKRPKVLISASAIGYYGSTREETLDEESRTGTGFLAELCQYWERVALRARTLGLRVVLLRTGIVLAKEGGALKKMPPVVIGRGLAWMSWIHIEDMIRLIVFAAQNQNVSGAHNVVSPHPVQNREFIRALTKARKIPIRFSVPPYLLRLVLGELSEAVLSNLKVFPKRALADGFRFSYPQLDAALKDIYK